MKPKIFFLLVSFMLSLLPALKGQIIQQNPDGVQNICPGSVVAFIVVAYPANGGDLSFQWEYSIDGGQNFIPATNGDGYHAWKVNGYTDIYGEEWYDTLIIYNIPSTFQNRIYRCVVTEQFPDPNDPTNIIITSVNSDTCLLGLDNVPPQLTVKTSTVYLDSLGNHIITSGEVVSSVSDNCNSAAIHITVTPPALSCKDTGETIVYVTAIDSVGNQTTVPTTLTVKDTIKPNFDYPYTSATNPVKAYLDSNGIFILRSDTLSLQNVWDNCAIKDTSFLDEGGNEMQEVECTCDMAGQTFPGWIKLTDSSDNYKLLQSYLVVYDTIKPFVSVLGTASNPLDVVLDETGGTEISINQVIDSVWDNCSVQDTFFVVNGDSVKTLSFSCDDVGEQTVTVRITDNSGNYNDVNLVLNIIDNELNILECQNYTRQADASGSYTVQGDEFDPLASDNCGILSITNDYNNQSTLAGTVLDTGTYEITWTATDVNNNHKTCTSTIEITATTTPTPVDNIQNSVKIYPNPATTTLNIDLGQYSQAKVYILETSGKLITTHEITRQTVQIDISRLPDGLYIIKIQTPDKIITSTFVK